MAQEFAEIRLVADRPFKGYQVIEPSISEPAEEEKSVQENEKDEKFELLPETLPDQTLYLTFDDGPSAEVTPFILDILKERQVKATFFLIGKNVRKYPEIARRIVDEGHEVAIHSDSHVYKNIYASVDSFVEDFNQAAHSIEEATGVRPVIYRFPGGSINGFNKKTYKQIIQEMNQRGYVYFDWNCSTDDTAGSKSPEDILNSVRKSAGKRKRIILLAHDTVPATAQALHAILDIFEDYQKQVLTAEVKPIRFSF